jgi:site-specific recombinase XerD
MIALLAARPIRLGNLAQMTLDKHLIQRADTYWLCFDPFETKTHVPVQVPVPGSLSSHITTYIAVVRAALSPDNALHKWMWCSIRGTKLSTQTIYTRVVIQTRSGLGSPISPHRFRHAAATTQAIIDPARVMDSHLLLGHSSYRATEHSYNLASTNDGAQILNEHLLARRKAFLTS